MRRECPVCHRAMTQALVCHVQSWHERVVVFEHVPADVCNRCGETLFTGAVVDRLNHLLWSMAPATRTIQASVYDLSEV
jgi:YgiT-type zinc finger domain-containing protein